MTAIVFGYPRFDHGRFLSEDPGFQQDAAWVRVFDADDEDSMFRAYIEGRIKEGEEVTGSVHYHRTYHVDEQAGEMWTIHPESGAALSSGTWEFDD